MADPGKSPNQEFVEHPSEDAEPLEDDELSFEELEEAAGGVEEYEPPDANIAC